VIAESFERIHRSNLVGMGLVPLEFQPGQSTDSLGLDGSETFTLHIPTDCKPGQLITVKVNHPHNTHFNGKFFYVNILFQSSSGKEFEVKLRFDTEVDLTYFRHGGILNFMIRQMLL
jgi:aconitate hydratase